MYVTDLDGDSGRWSPQIVASPDMVKTFDDAREVDELLRILQVSAEHDELKSAFRRLEQLFSSGKTTNIMVPGGKTACIMVPA